MSKIERLKAAIATAPNVPLGDLIEPVLGQVNKDGFDYYDFEHGPKRKNTKFFFIPNPAKLANMILSADISKFPDHSGKGPIERKSHDIRDIQNDKRRKMRKNK